MEQILILPIDKKLYTPGQWLSHGELIKLLSPLKGDICICTVNIPQDLEGFHIKHFAALTNLNGWSIVLTRI